MKKQAQLFNDQGDWLQEERDKILEGRRTAHGVFCPVCDQYCKEVRRRIDRVMGSSLFHIWNTARRETDDPQGWVHVPSTAPRYILRAKTYSLLADWRLIEAAPNQDDPTKNGTGFWRLTLSGVEFLMGQRSIQKYAHRYNRTCVGFSGEQVTVDDVMNGSGFDLQELRRGVPLPTTLPPKPKRTKK